MIAEFIRLTSTPSSLFGATKGPLGDTYLLDGRGDQIDESRRLAPRTKFARRISLFAA